MLDEACSWLWQLYSHSPITSSEYRPVKQVTAVELSLDLLQFIINAIRWDQHNENSKTDKQLFNWKMETVDHVENTLSVKILKHSYMSSMYFVLIQEKNGLNMCFINVCIMIHKFLVVPHRRLCSRRRGVHSNFRGRTRRPVTTHYKSSRSQGTGGLLVTPQ